MFNELISFFRHSLNHLNQLHILNLNLVINLNFQVYLTAPLEIHILKNFLGILLVNASFLK